jgi:hypothetical protein
MATLKIEIDTDAASGPHGNMVTGIKKIGFVSPISADTVVSDDQATSLYSWFLKGFNDKDGNDKEKKHKRKYDGLSAAIAECKNKHLIVTSGGLISYKAAALSADAVPFVSLLGAEPSGPPAFFRGGITLDSLTANRDRLALLMNADPPLPGNLRFANDKVGLLCNKNSEMNQREMDNWNKLVGKQQGNTDQIILGGNDAQGKNSSSVYPANFAEATTKQMTALVVSADPFFQDTKIELVNAANKWIADGAALKAPVTRYVCYPALAYANTSETVENQPTKNSSTLFGPKLEDAYYLLGVVAAAALKMDDGTLPFIHVPSMRKDVT